jgi:hypothetical protein
MIVTLEKTESGKNAIGIGGGAYTKSFTFRTVIGKTGALKPAIFIRNAGDLACQLDQAIAEIEIGDLILMGSGYLPIKPDNPGAIVKAYRIFAIGDAIVIAHHEGTFLIGDLPESVITGASIYHNRDGSYFAGVSS